MTVLIIDETPPAFPLEAKLFQSERLNDPMLVHIRRMAELTAAEQEAESQLASARAKTALYLSTIPAELSELLEQCRLTTKGPS